MAAVLVAVITVSLVAPPAGDADIYFNYDQLQWNTGDAGGEVVAGEATDEVP